MRQWLRRKFQQAVYVFAIYIGQLVRGKGLPAEDPGTSHYRDNHVPSATQMGQVCI